MAQGRQVFVLSGGGSRGAGQVGMLKAFWDAGITPDLIVGGSVGAINACFMASHPTREGVAELAARWMGMSEETLCGSRRRVVLNRARRRPYVFAADRLRRLVADWVPTFHLENLTIPVRIVTTDILTGRAVFHDQGYIPDLIAASAALPLPAIFAPVLLSDVAEPSDRIWVLDVTRHAKAHRHLRNPLDVLVESLVASVRNHAEPDAPHKISLHRLRLDEQDDGGSVFDFTHTLELFHLGEARARAEIERVLVPAA